MSVVLSGSAALHADGAEPWFDPATHLGPRGWRYLTPATRYVLAAAKLAMADARFDPATLPDEQVGVAIGTNFAAAPVVARFDEVVAATGADDISPAEAPSFSVNIPASQISMKHGLRAFNLTLTNPVVAGLEAVLTLRSALLRGRARAGIAGAVEERPDDTAAEALGAGTAGEGVCCLVLERDSDARDRDAPPGPEVLGGFSVFAGSGPPGRVLGPRLDRLLAGVTGDVPYAAPGGAFPLRDEVDAACREWAAGAGITLVDQALPGADGRDFTVSPLLRLTGLAAEPGWGLVVAASPHGHVSAVRLGPRR